MMKTFTVRIMKTHKWETSFPLKAENKDDAEKLALELIKEKTKLSSGIDRFGFRFVEENLDVYSVWSDEENALSMNDKPLHL